MDYYKQIEPENFFSEEYNQLFKSLYSPLCIYCLKIVDDMEAAKDIVQDQFANLWENWERLSKLDALKPYLYTSVKNRSINYLKKQSTKSSRYNLEISTEIESENNNDPHNILENLELEQIIENALNQLPKKCKEIFLLKRFAELTNNEIAEKFNISEKTVEAQMTIALKRIRLFVKKKWPVLLMFLFFFTQR